MANDKKTGIDRLEEEMERRILETSKEELLEEARANGRDPAEFAARMRAFVSDAKAKAGKARRAEARARLEEDRREGTANVVRLPTPAREQAWRRRGWCRRRKRLAGLGAAEVVWQKCHSGVARRNSYGGFPEMWRILMEICSIKTRARRPKWRQAQEAMSRGTECVAPASRTAPTSRSCVWIGVEC